MRLAAAALAGLVGLAGCGPWSAPAGPARTASLEVPVTAGTIGEHAARFTLGAPLEGEVAFDLPRCEWAGIGKLRIDRACVGTFEVRTPRGTLRGGARALWTGYRRLVALAGSARLGTGCFAGVTGGEVVRGEGPVSFPTLPLRVTLTLPATSACLPAAGVDAAALARAARAADPAASALALEALALALASPNDELRAAAAVSVGFAAPDRVYRVFRDALRSAPSLLEQAARTRELHGVNDGMPSLCEVTEPEDPELAAVCAAARRGFDAARPALAAALDSKAREVRRQSALQLVRLGGARARAVLEPALGRLLARGDLTAAVDLAEMLLLVGGR